MYTLECARKAFVAMKEARNNDEYGRRVIIYANCVDRIARALGCKREEVVKLVKADRTVLAS